MADKALLRALIEKMSADLVDQGCLIEAGFQALRAMALSPEAPALQVSEMRMAFFAGAQHVFGTIMNVISEDDEPTATDFNRLSLIDAELKRFIADFEARFLPTQGRA